MNTDIAHRYTEVSVKLADLFQDVGEEAKPHFRNGTVPEFSSFGGERFYLLWHLKGSAGAMYKTNYHLKCVVDGSEGQCSEQVIGQVHNQLQALFNRNLLRVVGTLERLIQCDRAFVVGMLANSLRNSDINQAINDHPTYLKSVLDKGEDYLATSEGMVALLGYSAGLAKGIREFADRTFDQMFPDKLDQETFIYLDSAGFSGLFIQLIEEINATYSFGLYVSTAFLSRKLLESLLIGILQRKFAGTPEETIYLKADGRYEGFNSLLNSFWSRFNTIFRTYSNIANDRLRDEMMTRIDGLRVEFNADVHQPGSFPSKAIMDGNRDDLIVSVNFLNCIYTNPRL